MTLSIPSEYVDVDFVSQSQYVFGDLGGGVFRGAPSYEDAVGVIPESEWKGLIDGIDAGPGWTELFITRVYNQKSEGSCVSNATGQAHEINQAKQYGRDKVIPLSAISLYKRVGRSPGSGSMLSDNLDEMRTRGILPLDTPENRAKFGAHVMPNTGFGTSYPSGWETTAKKFMALEWFDVRTVAGLMSALLRGTPVVVGRSGHSIVYVRPMYRNGVLGVCYVNSWGTWGFGMGEHPSGFGFDSASLVRSSASWAFAMRSVTAGA